ncbi:Stp1/IreP family PP2C-type Ser/Thr phosphatase [Bacillaceae bacterium SIJ1]|uniref:Stp1/IreP family PP2C-type Ser/Thr phosphatase n=1 Tax=Litoribacterium kuwaitense TaxID=1398745 RepID=UPI0013EC9158|nr:Stp1/IreP family PP2C-type Ser/Thr phosphatase [Litoribacterium kuwaitense]NGP45049.1 Stp1/IreP family PP2C-type Ser/Thr phosphatase [Litoribacterium kuwaitense]
MKTVYRTDTGNVREHNEDSVTVKCTNGQCLAIVADGMGGHRAGDVASTMAVSELVKHWDSQLTLSSPTEAEQWFREKVEDVNAKMYSYSLEHEECRGMGTTLVSAICTPQFVTIAHIGDSRGYVKRASFFRQVTQDHSLVNELVRSGELSREAAEHHPRKNVLLRALGTNERADVDIQSFEWDYGEYVLLCSDGLTNKLSEEELIQVLDSELSLDEKADQMVTTAKSLGGEDNISAALIYHEMPEEGRRREG